VGSTTYYLLPKAAKKTKREVYNVYCSNLNLLLCASIWICYLNFAQTFVSKGITRTTKTRVNISTSQIINIVFHTVRSSSINLDCQVGFWQEMDNETGLVTQTGNVVNPDFSHLQIKGEFATVSYKYQIHLVTPRFSNLKILTQNQSKQLKQDATLLKNNIIIAKLLFNSIISSQQFKISSQRKTLSSTSWVA